MTVAQLAEGLELSRAGTQNKITGFLDRKFSEPEKCMTCYLLGFRYPEDRDYLFEDIE